MKIHTARCNDTFDRRLRLTQIESNPFIVICFSKCLSQLRSKQRHFFVFKRRDDRRVALNPFLDPNPMLLYGHALEKTCNLVGSEDLGMVVVAWQIGRASCRERV